MSALDGRIRSIAREEAASVLAEGSAPEAQGGDVTELRGQVEELAARLDVLEKAVSPAAVAKRAARKPVGASE